MTRGDTTETDQCLWVIHLILLTLLHEQWEGISHARGELTRTSVRRVGASVQIGRHLEGH